MCPDSWMKDMIKCRITNVQPGMECVHIFSYWWNSVGLFEEKIKENHEFTRFFGEQHFIYNDDLKESFDYDVYRL